MQLTETPQSPAQYGAGWPKPLAAIAASQEGPFACVGNGEPQPMKHRVLLADDDAAVRESLRKLLHAEGYQVVLAANGVEAVEKSQSRDPPIELALLDLDMPLKNGWATLDRLLEVNPRLLVLVITGLPNQGTLAHAAGVTALVEKPIDVATLLQLMQELLAEPAQRRLQSRGRGDFPFQHLPAASQVPGSLWPEQQGYPYSHGGINE